MYAIEQRICQISCFSYSNMVKQANDSPKSHTIHGETIANMVHVPSMWSLYPSMVDAFFSFDFLSFMSFSAFNLFSSSAFILVSSFAVLRT
jgi:hypothetical protein